MMKIPYFAPWISKNDKSFVMQSLNQRWLTNGPFLHKFEDKFHSFIKCNHAVGVGSATHALHLATRSLGIGPGDEVIVPTFTFAATANAVSYCGAEPVLADVDPGTFNIQPQEIKQKITRKTKAVIVVHYGGQSCDMSEIMNLSKKHSLHVIEDCAHALGSTYKNKKCGSIGTVGCFSFYPTKIITTGEGGMVSTNNASLFRKIKVLKSQGMDITPSEREVKATWKYDIVELGYNYRLDEMRAALGLSQISRVNKINDMRIKIAKKYDKLITKIKGLIIPETRDDRNHIYHLYTIKVTKDYHMSRDELFLKLHKMGIGTSVQYYPLHLMSYMQKRYLRKKKQFGVANTLKDQVLCLPIYPQMTTKQIEYVAANLQ